MKALITFKMVADALVYHPAVSHYLRYVQTVGKFGPLTFPTLGFTTMESKLTFTFFFSVGRDKVLRTIQYFSRFYAWYLYRTNNPTKSIQPWVTIKNQFGLTRKIMRVGKFVEHFRAASEIYDAAVKSGNGDKVAQYLQILRQLGYGGYLLFDTMTVLDAMGVKKLESIKKVQENAYRFWTTGLLASAIAGLYAHYQLRQRAVALNEKDAEAKVEGVKIAR